MLRGTGVAGQMGTNVVFVTVFKHLYEDEVPIQSVRGSRGRPKTN
jgi:hypothetical protein